MTSKEDYKNVLIMNLIVFVISLIILIVFFPFAGIGLIAIPFIAIATIAIIVFNFAYIKDHMGGKWYWYILSFFTFPLFALIILFL